mgnify:CR=1 FL=1
MKILNEIVSYWYDCIKNEDILEKDISIHVRSKAVLYPFDYDPFVFDRKDNLVPISKNEKLAAFSEYINTRNYEVYYGYPLLFYYDDKEQKYLVAPLFIIKVKFLNKDRRLYLQKDEQYPTCGIQALGKLGFRTEEIADLSQKIDTLFRGNLSSSKTLAKKCLEIIQQEADFSINETIDPTNLTNDIKISKTMAPGLYNKSLVFAGENTDYNMNLLRDLLELKEKQDLDQTALSYILENISIVKGNEIIPVLPFSANEYQVKALQNVFSNKLSVITGPPGTGKSQFISNLLINLFLEGKSVLFVSHTNEAVNVVNEKLNEQFKNLMIRTGNKEFRQQLKERFNEIILMSQKTPPGINNQTQLRSMWQAILKNRAKLIELDQLEKAYEEGYLTYKNVTTLFYDGQGLEQLFEELLIRLKELKKLWQRLEKLRVKIEKASFPWWETFLLIFFPDYARRKRDRLFEKLNCLLPSRAIKILQASDDLIAIKGWDEPGWLRLQEFIDLLTCYVELKKLRAKLDAFQPRAIIEGKIKQLENDYFAASRKFVADLYIHKMLENEVSIGRVISFLNEVNSRKPHEDGIDSYLFKGALDVLKVWSSTLKSIRSTFPLSPGIFDYVIFDEASQVDLPSAAPALYRAKRAIVVGDPMQLTHVAGITVDIDKELAHVHGLTEYKAIYPPRIRYCDVSLYRSAENSLVHKPILLTNHYRSEDQIISLCNQAFYGGHLKIMTKLDYSRYPGNLPIGVHWIDCRGEVFKHPAGSRINQKEVERVNKVFQDLLPKISSTNLTVGIVTPYSRQQDAIAEIITKSTPPELIERHNVKVLTAHKFQGSEKDIMIFSLVLASQGNGNSDRWYNIYPQILNVALSRAKYLLYIVGDKSFCHRRQGVLKTLVETYDEIKRQEKLEKYILAGDFDSPTEKYLFERLQAVDFEQFGYELRPKLVFKRYTLDFALLGKNKIDVECDGTQHEIIEGFPVIEDVERDDFMTREGWKVLRFPNHRVLSQTEAVIEQILKSL